MRILVRAVLALLVTVTLAAAAVEQVPWSVPAVPVYRAVPGNEGGSVVVVVPPQPRYHYRHPWCYRRYPWTDHRPTVLILPAPATEPEPTTPQAAGVRFTPHPSPINVPGPVPAPPVKYNGSGITVPQVPADEPAEPPAPVVIIVR